MNNILKKINILFTVAFIVFSQESYGRLTVTESVRLVEDAVTAKYITPATGEKLKAYFSNPDKRKELGAVLFQALSPKNPDDIILETEKVLEIPHHPKNHVKRLRSIANLLLPCWTGGMTCYRVTKQAHSLSFLLYTENKEALTAQILLHGWQKDTFGSIGTETTRMLNESIDVSQDCELEKSLRLIACSELIDSMPIWKDKKVDGSVPVKLDSDIVQIFPTPNTFKKTLIGDASKAQLVIDGNCMYTTLRHVFLLLVSKCGTDKPNITMLPPPLQTLIEGHSVSRLLSITQHDIIRTWDEYCVSVGIEHTPTAWGIANGFAKLSKLSTEIALTEKMRSDTREIPLIASHTLDTKAVSTSIANSLSEIAKRKINCVVIDWPDGPYWASELIVLHDPESDTWIGIGCGELQKFLREQMPTPRPGSSYRGLHSEIIGIWNKPSGILQTTLRGITIDVEKIRPYFSIP
ncbi:MAG: hypothetical protein IJ730_05050 [Alphaproteobacteria bacterium]|nr:hypothetical protein [Alphaproteobacteria bacterium]